MSRLKRVLPWVREHADWLAMVASLTVVIAGVVLWAENGVPFETPVKRTTVHEVGVGPGIGKKTLKTETGGGGDAGAAPADPRTREVERPTGHPSGKVQKTVEEGSRSLPERVFGKSGRALLQIVAILLAAFLSGAFVKRLLMGNYAFKFGPLDLSTAEKAEDSLIELAAKVTALEKARRKEKAQIDSLIAQIGGTIVASGEELSRLQERVATLEEGRSRG